MKKIASAIRWSFLCCVILDNRESVYIAYSVLFLYNIEINVLGN